MQTSSTPTPPPIVGNTPQPARTAPQLPLLDVLSPLWKRWRLLALVFLLSLGAALALTPFVKQKYKSEAVLILDRASNDIATFDTPLTNLVVDSEAIASEIEILYSSELAARVVESEGLLDTDEFNPKGETSEDVKRAAVQQFLRQLEIQRKGISRAIVVKFESTDPERAAHIVNAIVEQYLQHELNRKIEQESIASTRLTDEISALEARIADSEVRIAEYRQQVGQSGSGEESRREMNIAGLNTQRVLAQAESTAAEALLRQARSLADNPAAFASLPSSDISPSIQRLRSNELDLQTKLDQLKLTFGEKHPQVLQTRNQLNRTRRDIKTEIDKSLQVLEGTAENARRRVQALTSEMEALEQAESTTWSSRAQLLALERERQSDVERLEFYASRLRELSQSSSIENLKPFARVISSGQVSDTAEFPNQRTLLFLLPVLATLGFLGLLIVAGLFRRFTIGSLPPLPPNTSWFGRVPSASLPWRRTATTGLFANKRMKTAVQAICRSIDTALASENRLVMLSGSSHGVGVSTLAVSIARHYAQSGKSTVLVDLDLRKSTPAGNACALDPDELYSADLDQDPLEQALQLDKRSGLHQLALRLPSDTQGQSPSTEPSRDLAIEQLLSSHAMERLLHTLSLRFSRVILDLPPVLEAPDSAIIARLADLSLIVTTPARLNLQLDELYKSAQRLQTKRHAVLGVILNRMDVDMLDTPCLDYVASDHHHARVIHSMTTAHSHSGDLLPAAHIQEAGMSHSTNFTSTDTAGMFASEPSTESSASAMTPAQNRMRGESWLLRQPASKYTLRLMTTTSRPNGGQSSLTDAADLPLACYMRRTSEGDAEYVVLLGLFDSHAAAEDMLQRLAVDPLPQTAAVLSLSEVSRDILRFRSVLPAKGKARLDQDVA